MATRFRLTNDTTAPSVSPTLQSYTHNAPTTVRRKLLTSDSSALTTTAYTPDADISHAGDALWCQFVSDPMMAGRVFSNGDAISVAMQGLEAHANNNLFLQMYVAVVSQDGNTVRRVLRSKVSDGTEWATTLESRVHATTQDGASYTTVAGDRLVVELSAQGSTGAGGGTQGHNGSMRFGGNGAGGDITTDAQTGTTLNPWFEVVPNDLFVDVITQTFTVNAIALKNISSSFTINAIVQKNISGSAVVDAIVLTTLTGSATLDAIVFKTLTQTFTIDAEVTTGVEETATWVSPADGATHSATPELVFLMPAMSGTKLHFQIQLDTVDTFDGANLRTYTSFLNNTGWEYWDGDEWLQVPTTGVPMAFSGNEARLTVPSALTNGTWYRRVRAGSV